jgi:Eukaryotic aspartyl protease
MFATGSSDLIVPSVLCKDCDANNRYNPSRSSKDLSKTFNIPLLEDASVSGKQYSDVVRMGGSLPVCGAPFFKVKR